MFSMLLAGGFFVYLLHHIKEIPPISVLLKDFFERGIEFSQLRYTQI